MAGRKNETPVIRCAIYTRKSTNEGLDQEFNSLDAQRESGENCVTSMRGEGWQCKPDHYDDGGYTGGNIDRPAFKRLMADVEDGKVDCIVVYKVDRLSRSLLDFTRIMEKLEKHDVSFVSVTQQFNTTTSMGRLTLNMLLSFAQFEREITSERTRDKIAAARRKGKWTGGYPILGYDRASEGGRLIVNKEEAEKVRSIFEAYTRHQALLPALQDVKQRGWRNKAWITRKGRPYGGNPFNRSTLHRLLTNKLYIGKVTLGEEVFEGEHEGIVDKALWDRVQSILQRNKRKRNNKAKYKGQTLLAGILRCARCGTAMTHHYTSKGKRRYRYYVCCNSIKNGRSVCPDSSLPAQQVENFVVSQLVESRGKNNGTALSRALKDFSASWQSLSLPERRGAFRQLVERVECDAGEGRLSIHIRLNGKSDTVLEPRFYFRTGPYGGKRMTAGTKPAPPTVAPGRISRISRLMALAIRFDRLVCSGKVKDYAQLARLGHVTRARITQIMNLLNLAPDIQEKILFLPRVNGGRDSIILRRLQPIATEPDWQQQRKMWPRLTGSLV